MAVDLLTFCVDSTQSLCRMVVIIGFLIMIVDVDMVGVFR